jgi:hypothetical protein
VHLIVEVWRVEENTRWSVSDNWYTISCTGLLQIYNAYILLVQFLHITSLGTCLFAISTCERIWNLSSALTAIKSELSNTNSTSGSCG